MKRVLITLAALVAAAELVLAGSNGNGFGVVGHNAATVIAISGESAPGGGLSLAFHYGPDDYSSVIAVGWTNTLKFSKVSIIVEIASNNPVGATGEAFLTTKIGPGTTIADQVATTRFVFPAFNGTFSTQLTLFTGLTLAPGTYYLTIVPDAGYTAGWNYTMNPTISSNDAGAMLQPASGLYLFVHDTNPANLAQ